jgi:hypothetical protein
MVPYEDRLGQDHRWGLNQGSRHFERDSDLFHALRRFARVLGDRGISYAVMGGMALFEHGYKRFTIDVDLLVTPEGLLAIHKQVEVLGCVRPSPDRRSVCDIETGVRFDFFLTGMFPGDGKPKPVAFPDPAEVGVEINGINYLRLETLVELKLASGIAGGIHRMKDLADAIALIKVCKLPVDFTDRMNPYVHDRYREYWPELQLPEREP